MKRIRDLILVVSFIISIMLVLAGCGKDNLHGSKEDKIVTDASQVKLYDIDITIASPNVSHIYSAKYPYYYYWVDSETHRCRLVDMKDDLPKVISREDFNVFADFMNEQDSKPKERNTFAYSINLTYYDENDEMTGISYYGYDEFPEELNVLIDKFNELSGQAILTYPEELITSEVDFIYDEFGLTESDYSRNEIEAMLAQSEVKLHRMISSNTSIDSYMRGYYFTLEEAKIAYLKPTEELPGVEISDEEFREFIENFLAELGDDWTLGSESSDHILVKLQSETHGSMFIGRAIDLRKLEPDFDKGCLFLDAGCEGMTYSSDFIYNNAGNYFLTDFKECDSFVEIAEIFAGLD